MISDQIGDLLSRIRNAIMVSHESVVVPFSNFKMEILKIFKKEGYIKEFKKRSIMNSKIKSEIIITLKYKNKISVITNLKRISKPGLRQYSVFEKIPSVINNLGCAIISTSKGLLTDSEARKNKVGGEVIAYIW